MGRGRKKKNDEEKQRELLAKNRLRELIDEIKKDKGINQRELVRLMSGRPSGNSLNSEDPLGYITDDSAAQRLNHMKNPNNPTAFTVESAQKICEAVNGHSIWDGIYDPSDYRWQWLAGLDDEKHPDWGDPMSLDELMKDEELWYQACIADPEHKLIEHYELLLINALMAWQDNCVLARNMEEDTIKRTKRCRSYSVHTADNREGPELFNIGLEEMDSLRSEVESFIRFKIGEMIKRHEKEIIPFD